MDDFYSLGNFVFDFFFFLVFNRKIVTTKTRTWKRESY